VTDGLPSDVVQSLLLLPQLYGDIHVLDEAEKHLKPSPDLSRCLNELRWLSEHMDGVKVGFDLADLRGYAYYTGVRFAFLCGQMPNTPTRELARGGRYDAVGAIFGRNRPAVGFSLDVKDLVAVVESPPLRAAILAPWGEDPGLQHAVRYLRARGETVVCLLPGHEHEVSEFHCDRRLLQQDGQWVVESISNSNI
jgi:ATP phosphoribosyltransferase regulatory subunit